MKLSHLTSCNVFNINSPIWNGGKRVVGLNKDRISKHNEINFLYRRKSDGQLSFPDVYYFDGDKMKGIDYPLQNIKGLTLVLVPFSDLEILERD